MYLAGAFLLFAVILLMVGNLLADIALAWVDPRIRYQ
jgi:peptide/nickel transport system permease protein